MPGARGRSNDSNFQYQVSKPVILKIESFEEQVFETISKGPVAFTSSAKYLNGKLCNCSLYHLPLVYYVSWFTVVQNNTIIFTKRKSVHTG